MEARISLQLFIGLELRKLQLENEIKQHAGATTQSSANAVAMARKHLNDCEDALDWLRQQ